MKCYLCGSKKLKIIKENVRHNIPRKVLECQNCSLNFLNPKNEELEDYYTDDYRKTYTPVIGETIECKKIFDMLLPYQQAREDELKHILTPEMKVLDVGCSTGHFLYTLKKDVKEVIGIEYNQKDSEFTRNELGIKTYSTSIEDTDLPKKYFDLITFYQVLEHLEDPIKTLMIYKDYLKDTGYICVEVPNINDILINGYQIESYKNFWFRKPHLFNFSSKTLKIVMEKAGFKGTVKGIQYYNFINHLNWVLTGKPQKSVEIGWNKPLLIKNDKYDIKIKNEINQWFERVNDEYQKLLVKHEVSESILFIGQKI